MPPVDVRIVSIHALLAECDFFLVLDCKCSMWFQSTHSLRSATRNNKPNNNKPIVSIHALLAECDIEHEKLWLLAGSFNPRTPCGVRPSEEADSAYRTRVSIHALLAECDCFNVARRIDDSGFNPRTPCGVRPQFCRKFFPSTGFQSTHSLRSATAPNLIHCYSTKQIILCANLPKKTVIARLLFLSIYLSIFYSQCITPIADLPGNSCELEVGAQAMFNSL